jgi:hypothetical protein
MQRCFVVAMIVVVSTFAAGPGLAQGIPDVTHHSVGNNINLGGFDLAGDDSGVVDSRVVKEVIIRDAFNNGLPNQTVTIRFANCTSQDIRLSADQPHHPGGLFDCANKMVSAVTDANGVARFRVAGSANNTGGNSPGLSTACAEARIGSTVIGMLRVAAYDQNGVSGVNPVDLSLYLSDLFGPGAPANYRCRVDYNGDLALNVIDLSYFLTTMFQNGSKESHSICP